MVRFKLELTRWARSVILARPATHGLVGVRDVDEQIIDEALVKFDAEPPPLPPARGGHGARHHRHDHDRRHAGPVRGGVGGRSSSCSPSGGAGYPFGYLLWGALIPYHGIADAARPSPSGWSGSPSGARPSWRSGGSRPWSARAWCGGHEALRRRPRPARWLPVTAALLVALAAGPAAAHHVGAYVPRDNEVSANFKQIKFAIQARKLDVALRLFESGALRAEMRAQAARLPAGPRGADARRARRGRRAAGRARAHDLLRRARPRPRASRPTGGSPTRRSPRRPGWRPGRSSSRRSGATTTWSTSRSASTIRRPRWPSVSPSTRRKATPRLPPRRQPGGNVAPESRRVPARPVAAPDPEKMREPLQRIALTLSGLIETSTTHAVRRRSS